MPIAPAPPRLICLLPGDLRMRPESAFRATDAAAAFAGQRVLLTGASGFLGRHVADQGIAAGVQIHALGRSPGPAGSVFHPADLADADAVGAQVVAIAPQAVIHCAAPGVRFGTMRLAEMLAVSALGSDALYAACAALEIPPATVHVGSGFEYEPGDVPHDERQPIVPSGSEYGAAKAAASAVAGAYADRLPIMLVRPFHIYGAGEAAQRLGPQIIAQARAGKRIDLTAGEQRRDFLHVDDCARCLWAALAAAPQTPALVTLNLGSGETIALRHFVEQLAAELAAHAVHADLAFGALPYRAHEPMVSLPDTSKIRELLDWRPRISLAQGIADLVRAEIAR